MDLKTLIPFPWLDALDDVRQAAPSACLVGGCLRDLAMGGPVKDIDIFVPYSETDSLALSAALSARGWVWKTSLVTAAYQVGMRGEVRLVEEWRAPNCSQPIQIIHLIDGGENFAEMCWSRVDFDACQVVYDGHEVRASRAFWYAILNRRFTLLRAEDEAQFRRSQRRAARFQERYPDMTIDLSIGAHFAPSELEVA